MSALLSPRLPGADRVVAVVVNFKSASHTIACLRSLEPELAAKRGARVVVVENASGEEALVAAAIRDHHWEDWVSLDIAEQNGGFACGNNRAIRAALAATHPPEYFLLLNPDTTVFPGAVTSLLEFLDEHPAAGIAGCSYERGDGTNWPIAFRFMGVLSELDRGLKLGVVSRLLHNHTTSRTMGQTVSQVDWIAGACMLIRRSVFEQIGLLDDGYFLYFEETDFCLRARRAGWSCWYVPQSRICHIGHESILKAIRDQDPHTRAPQWYRSRRRYFLKNHGLPYAVAADLAYATGRAVSSLLAPVRVALGKKSRRQPYNERDGFWTESVLLKRNRSLDG